MIGGPRENSWSPSIWARHLRRAPYWTVGVAEQHITVMTPAGVENVHVAEHEKLHFETGSIWARMSAPELGIPHPLPGLPKRAVTEFRACVARELEQYESTLDLQPFVEALVGWWSSFQAATREAWEKRRWLTEEFIVEWDTSLKRVVSSNPLPTGLQRALVDRSSAAERDALNAAFGDWAVRSHAADQNNALVNVELIDERDFFDRIEKTPLTEEQARAVICFDNRVQLVASAGSGKTSTMVAKAGWTIRKNIAKADEILLLAFNKAAAAELGERCASRLANAEIPSEGLRATTFHAFGLRVIGEVTGEKPRLAPGLDKDNGVGLLANVVRALRRRSSTLR